VVGGGGVAVVVGAGVAEVVGVGAGVALLFVVAAGALVETGLCTVAFLCGFAFFLWVVAFF
jgi:hypothetical protein